MSTTSKTGTALITGASTGIGSVYAHRLAQRGYDLILVARDQQRLTKLANDITAKTGRKAETLTADLTVKADLKRVEERLRSDRTITALVNNAGFGGAAKLVDSNVDDMDNMIKRYTQTRVLKSGQLCRTLDFIDERIPGLQRLHTRCADVPVGL